MRLIDADRLKAHYCWWSGGSKEMTIDEAKKTFDTIVDVQPTVDAVEVVRCKDCIHNSLNRRSGNAYCELGIGLFQLNDFCSEGERRKDAKTD